MTADSKSGRKCRRLGILNGKKNILIKEHAEKKRWKWIKFQWNQTNWLPGSECNGINMSPLIIDLEEYQFCGILLQPSTRKWLLTIYLEILHIFPVSENAMVASLEGEYRKELLLPRLEKGAA